MDTPFQLHLGTNYAPTIEEARSIQGIIDASAHDLVALDAQIDSLQRQLDMLHEKRKQIYHFAEQHCLLLSPVRKLPGDILEHIFLFCLPSDRNPCMSASEAPMLLTRICSLWRKTALSAPRLWAAIHIILPNLHIGTYPVTNELRMQIELVNQVLKQREAAVKEWLDRSGVCLLSISVYEVPHWLGGENIAGTTILKDIQEQQWHFIASTVVPYYRRWRELDICLTEQNLEGIMKIGFTNEDLRLLESLHITFSRTYRGYGSEPIAFEWEDVITLLPSHATSATFRAM